MTAAQLRVLAVVLAALLVLWGATRLFSRGSDVVRGSLALPVVSSGDADSVVITHRTDTIRLARAGTSWTVNGHPAAATTVTELFRALHDSTPPELAAVSRTSFARMGVDSAGWTLRVASRGTWALALVVGNAGSEYGTGYVRRDGADSVFLWRGQLPELVHREPDAWRDHRIAAVLPESIRAVDVERAGRRWGLRSSGHAWQFANGAPADSAQVASFLGRFRALDASGFATPAQADSVKQWRPRRRVTLRGSGSTPLLDLSFDSTAAGYWARRQGDSTLYRIDAWRVDDYTPADSTLKAKRPGTAPH